MLVQVPQTPAEPAVPSITAEEAAAGARAIVNLFEHWQLGDEAACDLLGGISRSTWTRWKSGSIAKVDRDLATRISLLLGIHKGLRYLFSDRELGYAWIKQPNMVFGGSSPLDVMKGGSIFALERIRRYLDAERGGW
ncbi:antitoxin Xre-like helix-turn-helix domain-containing protein [Novosphingobium sp. ZW T3_23]|uniref:antitoxin Xre-like helix-turn-helix domain-containing protein n=1 Tax=Novosphingobium sp. ZW T3_23 TaxID=3378084 RepID=UPI0038522BEE